MNTPAQSSISYHQSLHAFYTISAKIKTKKKQNSLYNWIQFSLLSSFVPLLQLPGGHLFSDASPPNPPIVTTTTIPESELKCDEMFEAIVPADDSDDRMVTTTSSVNAQLLQEEEEVAQESMSAAGLNCMQLSNGHHHQHHPAAQQQLTGHGPSPLHSMFFPFSPEDSPTPLGPNLQNTAEINSPEQVPLPSSTVSALPISDTYTISPELLQLPAHQYFQLWFSSAGSPCDSTSGGSLVPPLSPYLPAAVHGEQTSHCPPVYQELWSLIGLDWPGKWNWDSVLDKTVTRTPIVIVYVYWNDLIDPRTKSSVVDIRYTHALYKHHTRLPYE